MQTAPVRILCMYCVHAKYAIVVLVQPVTAQDYILVGAAKTAYRWL
jgi:hypothetical protein